MSVVLDHESWFNDPTPASPEPKDGSKSPTKFADWKKYYAAQSTARAELLSNQECTIIIPGNPLISAEIRLILDCKANLLIQKRKRNRLTKKVADFIWSKKLHKNIISWITRMAV